MVFLLLIPGFALPTMIGWLLMRLLEHRTPMLTSPERWILGFVGGTTFTMFMTFLLHVIGLISFTFWGFFLVQLFLSMILIGLYFLFKLPLIACHGEHVMVSSVEPRTIHAIPSFVKAIIILLTLWTILKIAGGALMLTQTPPYHDDVFNNWNLRAKVFFETQRLTLTLPLGNESFSNDGVSSYPPTVPMLKTWLALLHGQWHEGLANSIHMLWYLAAGAIIFLFLRRATGFLFALIGVYILSSIPLYLIHGFNAYADVFLSFHLLIPFLLLYVSSQEDRPDMRLSALRLGAFFTGLLVFTKNEALLLYLPVVLLCTALFVLWNVCHKRFTLSQTVSALLFSLGFLAFLLLPWLMFKYTHDLPFGNAKAVTGLNIGWQSEVLYALWINTFFEGNWIFLWPLFIAMSVLRWRDAFRHPLLLPTLFLLIVLGAQILLYLFTSLSEEALKQTGLARGLIHLVPITVFVTTILLYNTWNAVARPSRP